MSTNLKLGKVANVVGDAKGSDSSKADGQRTTADQRHVSQVGNDDRRVSLIGNDEQHNPYIKDDKELIS
eukprot:8192451-Karenia_brevis.AAC.1